MRFRLLCILACLFSAPGIAVSAPVIESIEGTVTPGQSLTLHGSGFSSKPNAKTYFVWDADYGTSPRAIARHQIWAGPLNGSMSSKITDTNSDQAFEFDHGSSGGAALAGVEFTSDRLFVFRRTYEDFDTSEDFAIRTRVENVTGTPQPGQLVTGQNSGATGVIQSVDPDGAGRWAIFYEKSGGTINDDSPVDFEYDETMSTSTATFDNAEGSSTYPTGTYRTFNFKTFRMWNQVDRNNFYVGTGRSQTYDAIPEYTDGKLWNDSWDVAMHQRPYEWKSEEAYYKASSLNTEDGILDFRVDNTQQYDHLWGFRDDDRPGKYDIVYQSQVSNGAQPESYIYYDTLYIDDTWHHVAACSEPTWGECDDKVLQIPTQWPDDEITVQITPQHLDMSDTFYLYVVDGQLNVNEQGFRVCPECPGSVPVSVH